MIKEYGELIEKSITGTAGETKIGFTDFQGEKMDNAFFNELKELAELARGSEEWSRKIYRMAILSEVAGAISAEQKQDLIQIIYGDASGTNGPA